MGNKNPGKRVYKINEDFFGRWNSRMAYILGFTCADGNVHGRSLSWDLSDKFRSNLLLLKSFNGAMDSNYRIIKKTNSYRLRVSRSKLLTDLKNLGVIPNKKKILKFPNVPRKYLCHFVRGFLDGDGWIITRIRKNGGKEICVGFSNGSYDFMKVLVNFLGVTLEINKFNLRKREKLTKSLNNSITYQLEFYSTNANKIINFLYNKLENGDLFLERKYAKAVEAKKFFENAEKIKREGKKFLEIEDKFGSGVIERYFNEEKLIPCEIAMRLGISLSTLYRWLDKLNIRKLERRGSLEWSRRIIQSKKLSIKNEQ